MDYKRHANLPTRVLLAGFVVLILSASTLAVEIFTKSEVVVENGTACVLPCTFKSSQVVSSHITVAWSFHSSQPDTQFSKAPDGIFYFYNGKLAPVVEEFKDRLEFIGDINKRDVSIRLNPAHFSDNGTYFCDVKNPPDFKGTSARTELRVVLRGSLPRDSTTVIVGAVCGVLALLVLILVGVCVVMKVLHNRHDYEGCINLENARAPPPQPIKKPEPKAEAPTSTSPPGQVQGPVIYVQLDHSGSKNSFHKMEPVVYADIRKN
ncbi:myelin protein zero-like 1 like [Syngnathoides biaculeatus]|uniref:myelin protein zero-like 1 like n=1 Tax=Syngnathoides biaculeatus TaxID=300417 RepID=UPI002ADDBDE3|nr:myelin protein zero-like 1 like [Syngnathoides biaculeatus]